MLLRIAQKDAAICMTTNEKRNDGKNKHLIMQNDEELRVLDAIQPGKAPARSSDQRKWVCHGVSLSSFNLTRNNKEIVGLGKIDEMR